MPADQEPSPEQSKARREYADPINSRKLEELEGVVSDLEVGGSITGNAADEFRKALDSRRQEAEHQDEIETLQHRITLLQGTVRRRTLLGFIAGVAGGAVVTAVVGQEVTKSPETVTTGPTPRPKDSVQPVVVAVPTPTPAPPTPTKVPEPTPTPIPKELGPTFLQDNPTILSDKNTTFEYDPYEPNVTYSVIPNSPVNKKRYGQEITIHVPYWFDKGTDTFIIRDDQQQATQMRLRVKGVQETKEYDIVDPRTITNPANQPGGLDRRVLKIKVYDSSNSQKPPEIHYVRIEPAEGLSDEFQISHMERTERQ